MKGITAEAILPLIKSPFSVIGEVPSIELIPRPIGNSDQDSFSFVDKQRKDKVSLLENSVASLVICPTDSTAQLSPKAHQCFIEVSEPKVVYSCILNSWYADEIRNNCKVGIHPSATIHPEAIISDEAYIGPHVYIGKSEVGAGTTIFGNCYLYDNVTVGKNVKINAGCVIGAEGFGFLKDENEIFNFPHIGNVVIEDGVEIGSNTSIDRGALGTTRICKNVKIDNLVHIAHNVTVGEGAFIVANAMIAGSTHVGANTFIGPSASLRDVIHASDNCFVGMGAVVTKNVPQDAVWTGSPARELKEFLSMQSALKMVSKRKI